MRIACLALVLLLVGPALAFDLQAPEPRYEYGQTVTFDTDASDGTLGMYAPILDDDTDSCHELVATQGAAPSGTLSSIALDRAGDWIIRHTHDGNVDDIHVQVEPRLLRILGTENPDGSTTITIVDGSTPVPFAWVDLYHVPLGSSQSDDLRDHDDAIQAGDYSFRRHMRADSQGEVLVTDTMMPFAGSYRIVAYKDLDQGPDQPLTSYGTSFTYQDLSCQDALNAGYDEPELAGVGPELSGNFEGLYVDTQELAVTHVNDFPPIKGLESNHRYIMDTTSLVHVNVYQAGLLINPLDVGLMIQENVGEFIVDGSWLTDSDLRFEAIVDKNSDGIPEQTGFFNQVVRQDLPLRIVPAPGTTLDFTVPAPVLDDAGNLWPGQNVLQFQVLDEDGVEGGPGQDVRVYPTGDILNDWSVRFLPGDDGQDYWFVYATPTGSNADYQIIVEWPGVGQATHYIGTPDEAGARITLVSEEILTAGRIDANAILRVERYNRGAIELGLCSQDDPECPYEIVTDADVALTFTQSPVPEVPDEAGESLGDALLPDNFVTNANHQASTTHYSTYISGAGTWTGWDSTPNACHCAQANGDYYFHHLDLSTGYDIVAITQINGDDNAYWAYADIEVPAAKVLTPEFAPNTVTAGHYNAIEITANGVLAASAAPLDQYRITITDDAGDVLATQADLVDNGGRILWRTTLPMGSYFVDVEERDEPPYYGRDATLEPGELRVTAPPVRYAYTLTDEGLVNDYGVDLTDRLTETWILGESIGDAVQLAIDVRTPNGQAIPGIIELDGRGHEGTQERTIATFAISEHNDPARIGTPHLFPPGEPYADQEAWRCDGLYTPPQDGLGWYDEDDQDCFNYYIVETDSDHVFTNYLQVQYQDDPILIWVHGIAPSDVQVRFKATDNSLNTFQPAQGTIHVVKPEAETKEIRSQHGISVDPQAIATGTENIVSLEVWDPTGINNLDGLRAGLIMNVENANGQDPDDAIFFGPGQRPGGSISQADNAYKGTVGMSLTADASGWTRAYMEHDAALLSLAHVVQVLPVPYIGFSQDGDTQALVPNTVDSGEAFEVRISTPNNPFPSGTLTIFNEDHAFLQGRIDVTAPVVASDTLFSYAVDVDGYQILNGALTVKFVPDAPLVFQGVAGSVDEGKLVKGTVVRTDPVEGVTVTFNGVSTLTDSTGGFQFTAPEVSAVTNMALTATHGGQTITKTVRVIDTTLPDGVLKVNVPTPVSGGEPVPVSVQLMDGSTPLPVPVGVTLTIESQRITLNLDGTKATGVYTPPRLTQNVDVLAIARAPGYEQQLKIVTILEDSS